MAFPQIKAVSPQPKFQVPTAIIQIYVGSDYTGIKQTDLVCVFSCVILLLVADLSLSFGFVIIVQHYNTKVPCRFYVMSYCYVFRF